MRGLRMACLIGAVCAFAGLVPAVEPQGYDAHQTVTFSGYTGTETLVNFPVLLRLPLTCFRHADYSDLAVIDGEGNLLAYDVDSVSDGKVLVWVRVPALTGTTTAVTAYFGKAEADAPAYTAADVWQGSYAAVWHLNYGNPADATGHELGQTAFDPTTLVAVGDAPLGNALRLNASANAAVWLATPKAAFVDQYITNCEKLTVTGWLMPAKATPAKATRLFCWKVDTNVAAGFDTFQNTDGKFYMRGGDKNTTCKTTAAMGWTANEWHHLAARFDGTSASAFLDGAALATEGSIRAVTVGDGANTAYFGYGNMGGNANLGKAQDFQYPFANGTVDELRIYNGIASADWIKAEYDTVVKTGFAEYGPLVMTSESEQQDGTWISSAAEANWSDPANWQGGKLPSGVGATVSFAAQGSSEQRIVLDADVQVMALVQSDAMRRTIAGATFSFVSTADITVADGSLELAEPFYTGALVKKGAGTLAFAQNTVVAGDLTVEGGEVAFAQTPAEVLTPAADGTFTPDGALWVTHVGFVEGDQAQEDSLRLTVSERTLPEEEGALPVDRLAIQTRWVAKAPGFLRDGVRYQRLPEPTALVAGRLYVAAATSGAAVKLLVMREASACSVNGILEVATGAGVSISTPLVRVHGLEGGGRLSAAAGVPAAIDLSPSLDHVFTGTTDGPVALIKRGNTKLSLTGAGLFSDGVTFRGGEVIAPTAATLDPAALLAFGDGTGQNGCGRLVLGESGEFAPAVAALRMTTTGLTEEGIAASAGTTLTLRGAVFSDVDRDVPIANGKSCQIALHAHAAETANLDPTLALVDSEVGYLDLAARVDGRADDETGVRPGNKIVIEGVQTDGDSGKVRKFTVQNSTVGALGGTVEFRGATPFVVDWFDVVGAQTAVVQSPGSRVQVRTELRFSDSTPTWESVAACDADWTIGDGACLIANGFPTYVQRGESSSNSHLRLDGGTLKINKTAAGELNLFPLAKRMDVELAEKGGTVDLAPEQGGDAVPVCVYTPFTGVGALTFTGDESLPTVRLASSSSHTGGTTASAVRLELAAPLALGGDVALVDGATLRATASCVRLGELATQDGEIEVAENASLWVDDFAETGAGVTKTGEGQLGWLLETAGEQAPEMTVNVSEGTFALSTGRVFNEPTLVAEGDFEPAKPITTGNAADRDRRAKKNTAYFSEYLTSWIFDSSNDGSGIASDGGYFTMNGQLAANGGEANQHAAYLRKTASVAAGVISREITTEHPNTDVTIAFDWNTRWAGENSQYWAKIGVLVDGALVHETATLQTSSQNEPSACAPSYKAWRRVTVKVLIPEAGTHSIAFTALDPVVDGETKDCEALLDNVRVGTSYALGGKVGDQLKSVTFNIAAGAKLQLDDGFEGRAGDVYYDGVKIRSTISARTQPAFVTGAGRLLGPSTFAIFVR